VAKRKRPELVERVEIVGELGPHDAEAFQLELRRLAKRYGIAIDELSIETSTPERDDSSA
jgi:hypothetical protein